MRTKPEEWNSIYKYLFLSSVFSVVLVTGRVIYSERLIYLFLIWNLFLAWVPVLISYQISSNFHKMGKIRLVLMLILWVIFLPNAPYMITDLFHLKLRPPVSLWYDSIILFTFAWNGILLFFISLNQIQKLVQEKYGQAIGWIFTTIIIGLSSYGIYVGRFLRFNSWDIFINPFACIIDIFQNFTQYHNGIIGMTGVYTVVILVLYLNINMLAGRKKEI